MRIKKLFFSRPILFFTGRCSKAGPIGVKFAAIRDRHHQSPTTQAISSMHSTGLVLDSSVINDEVDGGKRCRSVTFDVGIDLILQHLLFGLCENRLKLKRASKGRLCHCSIIIHGF
jgi:hypothetical protein